MPTLCLVPGRASRGPWTRPAAAAKHPGVRASAAHMGGSAPQLEPSQATQGGAGPCPRPCLVLCSRSACAVTQALPGPPGMSAPAFPDETGLGEAEFNEFYSREPGGAGGGDGRAAARWGGSAGAAGRSLLELPLLPAHGAVLLHLLRVEPLEDAVHVEAVGALAPDQRAVVSRDLACGGAGHAVRGPPPGPAPPPPPHWEPREARWRPRQGPAPLLQARLAGSVVTCFPEAGHLRTGPAQQEPSRPKPLDTGRAIQRALGTLRVCRPAAPQVSLGRLAVSRGDTPG